MQEQQKRSDIVAINGRILRDKRLTPTQKLVYARIAYFETYFESAESAAEFLGLTAYAVQEAKRVLERLGYIKCIRNTGRGKEYVADIQAGLVENSQDLAKPEVRPSKSPSQTSQNAKSHLVICELRPSKSLDIDKDINKNIEKKENMSQPDKPVATPVLEATVLAEKLYKRIMENKPNRKVDKKWQQNWPKDIEKLHRIDKRTWSEIEAAIDWSQDSDFWQTNILSGKKLREQIDMLESQMKREKNYRDRQKPLVIDANNI